MIKFDRQKDPSNKHVPTGGDYRVIGQRRDVLKYTIMAWSSTAELNYSSIFVSWSYMCIHVPFQTLSVPMPWEWHQGKVVGAARAFSDLLLNHTLMICASNALKFCCETLVCDDMIDFVFAIWNGARYH